jgi:hypothetical protein
VTCFPYESQLLEFRYGEALRLIFQDTYHHYQKRSNLTLPHAFNKSSSFHTARIPFPPPPAVAASLETKFSERFFAHTILKYQLNLEQGTPASIIVDFAEALSPILSIISGEAQYLIPCS